MAKLGVLLSTLLFTITQPSGVFYLQKVFSLKMCFHVVPTSIKVPTTYIEII